MPGRGLHAGIAATKLALRAARPLGGPAVVLAAQAHRIAPFINVMQHPRPETIPVHCCTAHLLASTVPDCCCAADNASPPALRESRMASSQAWKAPALCGQRRQPGRPVQASDKLDVEVLPHQSGGTWSHDHGCPSLATCGMALPMDG